MNTEEFSHSEKGLSAVLAKPWAYNLFISLLRKQYTQVRLVEKYIRPFPDCRILEIGCGTAGILSYLPKSIGEYTGFDMNPSYIEFAKKRWSNRANCVFYCQKVEDTKLAVNGYFDIVLALGIIHHLSDNEANHLCKIAYQVLKPGGVLITYDNVYLENQHWLAQWFISRDRGRAVRTVEGYKQIAKQHFENIEGYILHDTLRIPYTIFIMRCIK